MTFTELKARYDARKEEWLEQGAMDVHLYLKEHPKERDRTVCKRLDADNWEALRSRVVRLQASDQEKQASSDQITTGQKGSIRSARSAINHHPELVADLIPAIEAAEAKQTAERDQRRSFRFAECESHAANSRRRLLKFLKITRNTEFDEEERELLSGSASEITAILALIQAALQQDVNVDWDAELAKLVG